MAKKYHENVEFLKRIQIALIVICVVALVAYLYFLFQPKITKFVISDECGPISGSIMHSIKDEDACSNSCHNQYCTKGKEFLKSEFTLSMPCNTCICYCKG